ncbi:MAG: bifunctional copper resistance protein CopD/cytochrome c oxidase assembly protein [Kutzneria sp.]|nr:bifunctional copper resistance protein CopD/cytochrome c oxidase assembly protein [Kutzneria sp.]
MIAAVVGVVLTLVSGSELLYTDLGLPDPGAVTRCGITAVRVLTEAASTVCVGSLLFSAFLVPAKRSGDLTADGYVSLRTAAWAAALWCVGAVLEVPFTLADGVGKPVAVMLNPAVLVASVGEVDQAEAWAVTAVLVFVLAAGCFATLSWGWTATLFVLSLIGLVPVAASGHSASGGSHDLASDSLLYHLTAAAVWIGGLIALLAYARRRHDHLALAASRFSRIALVCWVVMALSGVVNALVRLPPADLFDTAYGLLVLVKVALLAGLGVFGYLQRTRGVKAVVATGSGRAMARLAAVEILVMFVTVGVASALARTPPPQNAYGPVGAVEALIGYPLDGPPTALRLLFDGRFDLVFGTASVLGAIGYLAGVRRLRRRGDSWPVGRAISWVCGCAIVFVATSSGIGRYAPAMFSAHMGSHMMLNMLAPALLVLGGPVTLALRALPVAGADEPQGPREWLLAVVHSPAARVLSHPVVALVLFVGSFYALYFSGLFDSALDHHWAHLAMNAHFILVGYLFYWPVIGVDPAPRQLPPLGRLGIVFVSIPFHAFFGVILMSMQTVIGQNFYRSLALPWVTDELADQRLGGGIAWASGEIPLLLVMLALLVQWARSDERAARRSDRKADADGDAELAAYNAMLADLGGHPPPPPG